MSQIVTVEQAVKVLDSFEFYMDGGVSRYPDQDEYQAAIQLVKSHLGITDPTPVQFGPAFAIQSKQRKNRGVVYPAMDSGMFAQLGEDSIRITGQYGNREVNITFKLGDTAEYDSYNLRYLGEIVKITDKAITIQPQYSRGETKRLDLYTFAWRNYNFDLAKVEAENADTRMCI